MESPDLKSSLSVRRKVLFVFLACALALVLAWVISRVAFSEMMDTVDKVTTPNRELEMVSQISKDIMRLDQLQRSQAFLGHNTSYSSFSRESKNIVSSLDSLKNLYKYDTLQQTRIDSIKLLLLQRDRLFNAYVRVREKVMDSNEFSEQLQSLSEVLYEPTSDSTIITTSQTRRVTTFDDEVGQRVDTVQVRSERGFLSRLFGSRKKQEEIQIAEKRTVEEEFRIHVDTIRAVQHDSTLARIDSAVQLFQMRQQQQRELFINREMELTIAGNTLIGNMLNILNAVELEVLNRMKTDNAQAKTVVNEGIFRIGAIILVFFVITAIMVYLILADIRKNNAYRVALEIAKEEAEYHAAAKQRFLANMSHELRTPLQSIIGYSEQIKQEKYPDPDKIDAIYQSSEHLLQIVNEILDYSRINSGKIVLNENQFAILELINNVVTVMKTQANKKKLELELNTRILGSGYLLGDAFRIRQILFNLLSNAIKFTDKGTVTLNVSTVVYGSKTELNIMVKDTGKGIPEEDLERIFDDFEQSENANSGVHFGSGLGLSIVKAICESMDGQIRVESKKNFGSIFKVNIPMKTVAAPAIQASQKPDGQTMRPCEGKVWIVDDDRFILGLCQSILGKHNIPYECFNSPKEVLAASWDKQVKTILMDIRMPEMNGTQLNQELRKRIPSDNGISIYAFTAQALPEEREQILAQGFDGILLKPFKEADLLNLLGVDSVQTQPYDQLDLSALDKLAMGDGEQVLKILNMYVQDTHKDIVSLQAYYDQQDSDNVELLLHRIAGRTAQIGAEKIAFKLRKMEIDTRNGEFPEEAEYVNLMNALHSFIQQIQLHTGVATLYTE